MKGIIVDYGCFGLGLVYFNGSEEALPVEGCNYDGTADERLLWSPKVTLIRVDLIPVIFVIFRIMNVGTECTCPCPIARSIACYFSSSEEYLRVIRFISSFGLV